MTQQPISFPLGGGMDLITPHVAKPPGRVIASLNYEPVAAGYKRFRGYERYSGQPSPSDLNNYQALLFVSGDDDLNAVAPGTVLTIGSSPFPPTAVVLASPLILSGTTAAGNAAGRIYVVFLGSFLVGVGEPVKMGATTVALTQQFPVNADNYDPTLPHLSAAREAVRAAIGAPGDADATGPVRGIFFTRDEVVAIRDNAADPTTASMYRATNVGWQPVNFGHTYAFESGGPAQVAVGDLLHPSGSPSNLAIVLAIAVTSGTWDGGDAAGTITVADATLFNGINADIYNGAANVLTVTSAAVASTIAGGGTYKLLAHNFYGAADRMRIYGANGVGKAIEYDPATQVVSQITTGMEDDTPDAIGVHRNSLFLGFSGGSIQFSEVGEPFSFNPVVGAGEFGIGDQLVDFIALPNAFGIFGCSSIHVLYGNDKDDYQLEALTKEAGALEYTVQRIGPVVYMDNRGIRTLDASRSYGNFSMGTISRLIEPLIIDKRKDGVMPTASLTRRAGDQYWLFFDDGTGLIVYMGGKVPSILPFNIGFVVTCAVAAETDGTERIFVGSDSGMVYEINKGRSFDGDPLEHYVRLAFTHFGRPQQKKRAHKVTVDMEASGPTTLTVAVDFDYGGVQGLPPVGLAVTTGGGALDDLGSNEAYFAAQIETQAEAPLSGVARTFSLKVAGSSTNEEPHTLTGVTYHISPRGMVR